MVLSGDCPFDGKATVVVDEARSVSGSIGRSGGSLATGGLTLTIPAGALSEDTTITVTPLLDLAGSPLAGSIVGGAKLEPEGLRFLKPALLSVLLPTGVAPESVVGFGSASDGSELHLQPHSLADGAISLRLWHFSTAGGSSGGGAAAAAVLRPISNAERQAKQRIAAAFRACNAETAQGIVDGPVCADVRPETIRALFEWYLERRPPRPAGSSERSIVHRRGRRSASGSPGSRKCTSVFRNDPAGTPRAGRCRTSATSRTGSRLLRSALMCSAGSATAPAPLSRGSSATSPGWPTSPAPGRSTSPPRL